MIQLTAAKKRRYYEKIVYYRCSLCKIRWNIFKYEQNMAEHLLEKHRFKLDETDKIAILRGFLGKSKLTKKDCLLYGIDFDRFKKYKEK